MADQFREVSSESWFGRIGNSIKGILVGLILLLISVVLLYWNEGRAVATSRSLKEGASAVVSVDAKAIVPANDKKLVHVTGEATTAEGVDDAVFNIPAKALRISREVSMYQWKEKESSKTQKNLGGGTETVKTYTYEKAWSTGRIDSSKFKHPEDHRNPGALLAENAVTVAPKVTLGAFRVPKGIIELMKGDEPLVLNQQDLDELGAPFKGKAKLSDGGFYFGADPAVPVIGDQRVTFKIVKPGTFSILAQQVGDTFAPYPTKAGKEIIRVENGTLTAEAMFQHAASENAVLTWALRGGGLLLMCFGFGMILGPLSVLADVIPFLGNIVGTGTALVALLLGIAGSLITVAVAWIAVRPVLGISLIVLAVAWFVFGRRLGIGARKPAPAGAGN
jgi:hypothetical protein